VVTANFLLDAESNLKAAVGGFGHNGQGAPTPANAATQANAASTTAGGAISAPSVGHKAEGTVKAIDAKAGTMSIAHGAIDTLKWPAMQMEFNVANSGLLTGLAPGSAVAFEFVERQPGDWVITRIVPRAPTPPSSAAAGAVHAGH
jgi:Cu/Ag efflux protein CusF